MLDEKFKLDAYRADMAGVLAAVMPVIAFRAQDKAEYDIEVNRFIAGFAVYLRHLLENTSEYLDVLETVSRRMGMEVSNVGN